MLPKESIGVDYKLIYKAILFHDILRIVKLFYKYPIVYLRYSLPSALDFGVNSVERRRIECWTKRMALATAFRAKARIDHLDKWEIKSCYKEIKVI